MRWITYYFAHQNTTTYDEWIYLADKMNTFKAIIEHREQGENTKSNDVDLISYDFDDNDE